MAPQIYGYGVRTRKSRRLIVTWIAVMVLVFFMTWYLTAGREGEGRVVHGLKGAKFKTDA